MGDRRPLDPAELSEPRGFRLRHQLRGHTRQINRIAWSPDGRLITSPSYDRSVRTWDATSGQLLWSWGDPPFVGLAVAWAPDGQRVAVGGLEQTVRLLDRERGQVCGAVGGPFDHVWSLAWSPDGGALALGCSDGIRLWDVTRGVFVAAMKSDVPQGILGRVLAVAWSPVGDLVASAGSAGVIRLHDARTGLELAMLPQRRPEVVGLAFSPDGRFLASASTDFTIVVWDVAQRAPAHILEQHTAGVTSVSFSPDGRLLGSKSNDGTVRLWSASSWEVVAILDEPPVDYWPPSLAFHPTDPSVLATLGEEDTAIRIWDLGAEVLSRFGSGRATAHYTSAKVVLVGESSTGKSCLARALMGEPFEPQESTHGMKVWNYQAGTVDLPDGGQVTRETLLWDLAGQIDYQLVHQLFLDEAALGIVLFDATDPEDTFRGVGHWDKALRRAAPGCPRLLVAGRVDRGGPTAPTEAIEAALRAHEMKAFFATSARTGEGVRELREAIAAAIPWESLPPTSSPELWYRLRKYLLARRTDESVVTLRADLRAGFQRALGFGEVSAAELDAVLAHAQKQGLVWPLSFGGLVLLRPELLNAYASAIVRVSRKDPDGLGRVGERDVLDARVDFEDLARLYDRNDERMLLHGVVELLIAREVAIREGEYLIFPSKLNRRRPEDPTPAAREVVYRYAGPAEEVYTTLVVRILNSGAFEPRGLYQGEADLVGASGGRCGLSLRGTGGQAELSISFDPGTSVDVRVLFLRFVEAHLKRKALSGSLKRERIYRCPRCREEVNNPRAVAFRLERGQRAIGCQFCEASISLIDYLEERLGQPDADQAASALAEKADQGREREIGITTARAKETVGEFDVFLAHHSADKAEVLQVAQALRQRGLSPWIDEWEVAPGSVVRRELERALRSVRVVAAFVGPSGIGPWEDVELDGALHLHVDRGLKVIPVLLPGAAAPELPLFLNRFSWLRFVSTIYDGDALDRLQWGITGQHPNRRSDGIASSPDATMPAGPQP